ncbi:NAD-dependent epimerase/dehydratase family protein [Leuconostoc mesenteroides]|uniref:NAD-dependent epimerase/dehydratase family protein n=2 Tax=Leuconostoc mesenteroides TaxID=1245 RepID=UPI001CBC1648|nr:NAD-dependent epimerase/dehydratase family protein [Leuconostoc mesenteroides]
MDNKKIIVIGGTGFVGQGILSALNNKDFELHSLSRHQFSPTDACSYTKKMDYFYSVRKMKV